MKLVTILALIFGWFAATALAVTPDQLREMLSTAAATNGPAYLAARQTVLNLGTNALPQLAEAATDSNLTWQQRLAARICYERIARGEDIEALRRYDWRTHLNYDRDWERYIIGAKVKLGAIVVPQCVEVGLWYYYVELIWKDTGELASAPYDPRINEAWHIWCVTALSKQTERHYLLEALIERLSLDVDLVDSRNQSYYKYPLSRKDADAVPILVQRFNAYFEHAVKGEVFPGSRQITYRGMFKDILIFADSRHADLIEKFIAEHPALAPLKDKVAEIRNRPAPPPRVEPPFRLGQQPVKP